MKLSCGRCIGCRLQRSLDWAIRLTHELRFHEESSFITLTYDDDHLPKDGSIDVKHFQDFMKRFRKHVSPRKIRFFHAGEYGERRGRPHYHAIIFGHSFSDAQPLSIETSDRGDKTWISVDLSRLWPFGLNRVGAVTFESCAYVARYVTKKITGPLASAHYERISPVDGEIFNLKPEYATMSRRPGIGYAHLEKYAASIYPSDECVSRGVPSRPPKFYDRTLEKRDPVMYAFIKEQRECALALSPKADKTERRLAEREIVKLAQIRTLTRSYEIG